MCAAFCSGQNETIQGCYITCLLSLAFSVLSYKVTYWVFIAVGVPEDACRRFKGRSCSFLPVATVCKRIKLTVSHMKPSGHYMYRTVVTICTAQWSLYVPHSGHYMYRTVVTICTTQWSLYVPYGGHYMYRTVVTICTAQWSLYVPHSGHYVTAQWSLYVPHSCHYIVYCTVVTICTTSLTLNNSSFCPHSVFMCFVWISEQTAIISLYN